MHLFIENQKWTLEFKHKPTADSTGPAQRFGCYAQAPPSYTTPSSSRPVGKSEYSSSPSRSGLQIYYISPNINKPSHLRRFRKKIGKMFHRPSPPQSANHTSPSQSANHIKPWCYEAMSNEVYMPEVPELPEELVELPGTIDGWELPVQTMLDTFQLHPNFEHDQKQNQEQLTQENLYARHDAVQQSENHSQYTHQTSVAAQGQSYERSLGSPSFYASTAYSSIFTPAVVSMPNIAMSIGQAEHQYHGFGTQPFSLASQTRAEPNLSDTSATATHSMTHYDPNDHNIFGAERSSPWERRHINNPQANHLYDGDQLTTLMEEDNDGLFQSFDDPTPPYHEVSPILYCPREYKADINEIASPPNSSSKKTKRSAVGGKCIKLLAPLSCEYCDETFKGLYQKGNRNRHIKYHHTSATDKANMTCRTCHNVYKREDARRKHEWKQHRMPDCRPHKKRMGKRGAP